MPTATIFLLSPMTRRRRGRRGGEVDVKLPPMMSRNGRPAIDRKLCGRVKGGETGEILSIFSSRILRNEKFNCAPAEFRPLFAISVNLVTSDFICKNIYAKTEADEFFKMWRFELGQVDGTQNGYEMANWMRWNNVFCWWGIIYRIYSKQYLSYSRSFDIIKKSLMM